ncbi:mediator of RNA polymerase II transcription subunit 7, partial [Tremellales sp. Uapishka_1]
MNHQPPAEEAAIPITNTLFPPPPIYYEAFTDANLERYAQLASSSRSVDVGAIPKDPDANELNDLSKLKEQLEKPRVDWIDNEGKWKVFGQIHTIQPVIPTALSIGLPPYVDPTEAPQVSLPPLLHSFLHTVLLLVDTLTNTARIPGELEEKGWGHEGDQYIQHLTNLAANMMVAANQLRGVQAEATLVLLMEKQLESRRAQTEALKT